LGIVCATLFLELGLPHETIRSYLKGLVNITVGKKGEQQVPALVTVLTRDVSAIAHFSESRLVRLQVPDYDYDSGWRAVDGSKVKDEPSVFITLDLRKILDSMYR
jgi:hypothetical protein